MSIAHKVNGSWKETAGVLPADDTPTEGSNNAVKSGGVYVVNQTKQNITDNTLQTTSKTVPGAINELNSKNQTLTNNVDVLIENGAVNLAENKGTTTTHRGITFTVNVDGTVTASGTNDGTGDSTIILTKTAADHLETTGIYKLSGCPSGGSDSTYYLVVYQGGFGADDYGDGVVFTNNNYGSLKLACVVKSGTDLATDITFKPMIADANYSGDYVPYAKTNRELTEETDVIFTASANETEIVSYKIKKRDGHVYGYIDVKALVVTPASFGTLSEKPPYTWAQAACNSTSRARPVGICYVNNNGVIVCNPVNTYSVNDRIQVAIDFYTT